MDGRIGWREWSTVDPLFLAGVPDAARPQGNNGTKTKREFLDIITAFDIETSRVPNHEQSVCYHWQMQIGLESDTIRGRELWQFRSMLDKFVKVIPKGKTLIIYVHNLSYEFHFLRAVFPEWGADDVFSLKPRKPVKVKAYGGRIEFRCSYALTNMSLGEWTKKMGVEHQKLDGDDFDYSAIRYPWTPMTDRQLDYCQNDVVGLVEALTKQLEIYGDTLATIPLTSTGYVRRDVKRTMRNWSYYGLQAVQPSDEVYVALREAFRGGDTHANRYYAGVILSGVYSADKSSAYPDACVNYEFPMGSFRPAIRKTIAWVNSLQKLHRALLMRLRFTVLRLRDDYDPCPYISFAKVRGVKVWECRLDNGRVLYAPSAETTITDIDWEIIKNQYVWDNVEVLDLWETRYGFLPDVLRDLIISYYEDKTRLKDVEGQEVYYGKAKALLNSIYGLQAQDPCKSNTVYDPDNPDLFSVEEGDIPALLAKSRRQPYGTYQWGVWCTAIARRELRTMITAAGDRFVYCDTDSVKYVGGIDSTLDKYNGRKIKQSKGSGAYADDPAGTRHYMGVFEFDGHYDRFVTLGAKKYAYEDDKGLHITVAGVGKRKGAEELKAAGGLEAFRPAVWDMTPSGRYRRDAEGNKILLEGMVFRAAGGTEAVYNDHTNMELDIDGHKLYVGPNIYLRESTYTLGVTTDYLEIIQNAELVRGIIHERNIKKALSRGKK